MAILYAYGRASTDRQQITILSQEEVCKSYFNLRVNAGEDLRWGGWHPDAAVTSKTPFFERPMGERLMDMTQPGDVIVVSNFDRIFRSIPDCDRSIRMLNQMEVRLAILDMDVRTDTPLGKAFMNIMAVIKELERDELSRRTSEAIQYKARHGMPINIHAPIGWIKVGQKKKSTFRPEPVIRKWCYEIVRLYESGSSIMEIYKMLVRRKIKPPNVRAQKWQLRVVRDAYVVAKCGFPLLPKHEIPDITAYQKYASEHGGRPPQLRRDGVSKGLLHTLPPDLGPQPVCLEPVDP